MKLRYLILSILTIAGISLSMVDAQNVTPDFFKKRSQLATGKWVKIGVDQTGVYEISYQTLREMGFSNPQRVGVYGMGGAQQSINFYSIGGTTRLYKDDISPVAVMHHNDKLYFYGVGTSQVLLNISGNKYDAGGYYKRIGKNIYSDTGYYFLSDVVAPKTMEVVRSTTASATNNQMISGLGYKLHEIDLVQNNTNTGQLFFGEKVDIENPRIEWNLDLNGAIPGKEGSIECIYYIDRKKPGTDEKVTGSFSYGFKGSDDYFSHPIVENTSTNYKAQHSAIEPMIVPDATPSLFLEIDVDFMTSISHLDYWVVNYQRDIPDLRNRKGERIAQDFIAFPKIGRNQAASVKIPGGASYKAIDIANPEAPYNIELRADNSDGWALVSYRAGSPELVIFDPYMPQLQIKGYETGFSRMANQNLHAQLAEGADLIIICIPQLKDSAERLAEIHRQKEGLRVVVASTDECYNEFSSGVPDPMAYRGAVKMAYTSDYGCKNLLLMGPLYGDFRGIINEKQPYEGIIAYQSTPMSQERGAHNANDFYGMMADYFTTDVIEKCDVNVGVGILPVRYNAEAETIIDKIEKYLDITDFAYYMNKITNIGGIGDNHTHDNQAIDLGNSIFNLSDKSMIVSPLIIDAYGFKPAQSVFFSNVNEGRLFVNYFGHGSTQTLNQFGDFFYGGDVYKFRNDFPSFMAFAGCSLSEPDKGIRGMGESMVTSTPYGMIGSLLASRETWSGQNMDFFQSFYANLFRDGGTLSSPRYERPLTIGEIYARSKTKSTYTNELAYLLICDPSIILPVPTRNVVIDQNSLIGKASEFMEISGYIPQHNDESKVDTKFNGTIVMRLMEPFKTLRSADICTEYNDSSLNVTYADVQISMAAAEVRNGKFSGRIFIPDAVRNYSDRISRLHFGAYSPEMRTSAASMLPVNYSIPASDDDSLVKDIIPPSIDILEYDPDSRSFRIKVSDNHALSFAADQLNPDFILSIDGKAFHAAAMINPIIDFEEMAYSKIVPVYDLTEGSHIARLKVLDAAGNEALAEITFDYLPKAARYILALKDGVANGRAVFTLEGEIPSSSDIVILDSNGMLVCRQPIINGIFEWNCTGLNGNPVAKGLYKAYMLETGTHSTKGHSPTIEVPVI